MKRPKMPDRLDFWRYIIESQEKFDEFMKRGNGRQKKALEQARRYLKWERIQKQKGGEKYEFKKQISKNN